jgi:hypothetical protein
VVGKEIAVKKYVVRLSAEERAQLTGPDGKLVVETDDE